MSGTAPRLVRGVQTSQADATFAWHAASASAPVRVALRRAVHRKTRVLAVAARLRTS